MPDDTSPNFSDRLHDKQIARANAVDRHLKDVDSKMAAYARVASEQNTNEKTIRRAVEYRDAIQSLPIDIKEAVKDYVNSKDVTLAYLRTRFFGLDESRQRDEIVQWRSGNFLGTSDPSNRHVIIPSDEDIGVPEANSEQIRESHRIQAKLAHCGEQMGFSIWLPLADRTSVLKEWTPRTNSLLINLPLYYHVDAIKTIERIDVLWIKRRTIVRAFEVEHSTAVYSGILRMVDMIVLLPDIGSRLHIVAPKERRDKVLKEIRRPVFDYLEPRRLSAVCSYLSYDIVDQIAAREALEHTRDGILDDYAEYAEEIPE